MIEILTAEDGTIRLVGNANAHHVAELYAGLTQALKRGNGGFALDLGGLNELDTAAVQVLVAFRRSVPGVRFHSCPQELRDMLDRTGLVSLLV